MRSLTFAILFGVVAFWIAFNRPVSVAKLAKSGNTGFVVNDRLVGHGPPEIDNRRSGVDFDPLVFADGVIASHEHAFTLGKWSLGRLPIYPRTSFQALESCLWRCNDHVANTPDLQGRGLPHVLYLERDGNMRARVFRWFKLEQIYFLNHNPSAKLPSIVISGLINLNQEAPESTKSKEGQGNLDIDAYPFGTCGNRNADHGGNNFLVGAILILFVYISAAIAGSITIGLCEIDLRRDGEFIRFRLVVCFHVFYLVGLTGIAGSFFIFFH